ncbi:hypothetical protein [Mycobacterium paraintracellulare]|uniref:hypothetical protein n=1 Tax=Mycobacterium paraintracellulare TaxID=1138383 RepID=UPI0019151E9B|nr:hypothetical protein [Mycobacterium paraintracellulare]
MAWLPPLTSLRGRSIRNFANKEAMLEAVIHAGLGEPLLTETQAISTREERQTQRLAPMSPAPGRMSKVGNNEK